MPYAEIAGQKLDPKVHINPEDGAPLPILVYDMRSASTEPPQLEPPRTCDLLQFSAPALYVIPAGCLSMSITNTGTAAISVGSGTLEAGESVAWATDTPGVTLGDVSVVVGVDGAFAMAYVAPQAVLVAAAFS